MNHYGKEVCTMIKRYKVRHLLIRAEKARGRLLQPLFHSIGLTFGQGHARILDSLLARDHVTQKELADICHMDVTTMSRSLDRLEESGYLVRERDPGCRRSFQYASQRQVWMKLKRSIRSWNLRTGRYGKACPKKRWNSSAPVWKRYVITWRTVIRQKGRFNRMYPAVQRCHGPAGCSGQLSSQISADVVQHLAAQKFKGLPCPSC